MADLDSLAVHPGIAGRPCRVRRTHRIVGPQLWFVAAGGSGNRLCLPLRHARLAARGGKTARVGRSWSAAWTTGSQRDFRRLSPQTGHLHISLPRGIASVPQQVWPRRRRRRRRPETDGRFRQGRSKTGDGQFRRRGGIAELSGKTTVVTRTAAPIGRDAFLPSNPVPTLVRQPWFSDSLPRYRRR